MMKVKYAADMDTVKAIQTAIVENGGYCPCSLDKTKDTKCMCKEFRDKVKSGEVAICHCGLYQSYNVDTEV